MKRLWQLHHTRNIVPIVCLACMPFNVSAQTKTPGATPSSAMQQQFAELRGEIAGLQKKVEDLESRESLFILLLNDKQDRRDSVTLDLTQHSYQRLDIANGFLLISAEQAVPYLNGYTISLKVGNPLNMTYSGFKAKVKWGKAYDYKAGTPELYKAWEKTIQEKEMSFPDDLRRGAWNKLDLILTPATAEQLGYVDFSISTDTVGLDVK